MKIDEVDALDCAGFVRAFGWVFEDSPWVAERARVHRPFDSAEALHEALVQEVAGAATDVRRPCCGRTPIWAQARA